MYNLIYLILISSTFKSAIKSILKVVQHPVIIGDHIKISIQGVFIVIVTFVITKYFLKAITGVLSKSLTTDNKLKFSSLFGFLKYFIYAIIGVIIFQEIGINVTPLLAASTALLVGVGLALQTLFQDIISGIFILIDASIKVGDIMEFNGKVLKVENIKLRTTRAITIDNKMYIIPNHHFLTNSLYNWTQNNKQTKDSITIGVAYGSDVKLVSSLLKDAVKANTNVIQKIEPYVFFEDFGDSALIFRVEYAILDGFSSLVIQSELRFEINYLFKKNNISIPFPQRDIHMVKA